jgi:hypothetical protein
MVHYIALWCRPRPYIFKTNGLPIIKIKHHLKVDKSKKLNVLAEFIASPKTPTHGSVLFLLSLKLNQ